MRSPPPNLEIRHERPVDIPRLHALAAAAFKQVAIADLLDNLRDDGALLMSHAAWLDGELAGQAAYSMVSVGDGECPALGPIGVAPAFQGQGIGGALIMAGMAELRAAGHGLLFLVGSPGYYPRFGFCPALPLGFTSDYVPPGGKHAHFMVIELRDGALYEHSGHVRYHPAFAGL